MFNEIIRLVQQRACPVGHEITIRPGAEGLTRVEHRVDGRLRQAYEGMAGEDGGEVSIPANDAPRSEEPKRGRAKRLVDPPPPPPPATVASVPESTTAQLPEPPPATGGADVPPARVSAPTFDDDVPAEIPRPAFLDASEAVAVPSAPGPSAPVTEHVDAVPAPSDAPRPTASVHVDGTGIHGALFDTGSRGEDALGEIVELFGTEAGKPVTFVSASARAREFRVPSMASAPRELIDEAVAGLKGILEAHGFDASVSVFLSEPAGDPPTPDDTPAAAPGTNVVIRVPKAKWGKVGLSEKARVKRELSNAQIPYDEAEGQLVTQPFPRSNAGVLRVLQVMRDAGVSVEPQAA